MSGAGSCPQQASLRLANNSLGSATLLFKNQAAGRRSRAERRAQAAEYMRRFVPASEIITQHSGISICNQTRGEWAGQLRSLSSNVARYVHCQPGMVRQGSCARQQEGVNGSCRLGPRCYPIILYLHPCVSAVGRQARQPACSRLDSSRRCDYFFMTPVSSQPSSCLEFLMVNW